MKKIKWKTLGEICEIKTGQQINKRKIFENKGIYPVINSGKQPLGYINTWNTEDDPIGITTRGAGVGSITYQIGKYFRGNLNYSVTIKNNRQLNTRFLYHLLLEFQKSIYKLCTFDGIPALNSSEIKKLEIPLPPLKKQAKIAAVLDKFTELTEELTEELTAREAQYDYYRNMLLSQEWIEREEGEEVEWKALEEIFDTRTGYTPSKKIKLYWENGTVDWFTIEDINQKGKNLETANVKISETGVKGKLFKGNSVVLSTNASVGKYALIKNDFTINQRFMVFTAKKEYSDFLNMEFAKYYFSQISEYCLKNLREGKFPSVDLKKLLKFKFPIPSLKTQKKNIDILDNFETLVNDIRQGLPREIELRQKQYYKTLLRISTNENKLKYL